MVQSSHPPPPPASSYYNRNEIGIVFLLLVSFVTNVTPFLFSPHQNHPHHHAQLNDHSSPSILHHHHHHRQQQSWSQLYNTLDDNTNNDNVEDDTKKKSRFSRWRENRKKKKKELARLGYSMDNDDDDDDDSNNNDDVDSEEETETEQEERDESEAAIVEEEEEDVEKGDEPITVIDREGLGGGDNDEGEETVVNTTLEEETTPSTTTTTTDTAEEVNYGSWTAPSLEDADDVLAVEEEEENVVVVSLGGGKGFVLVEEEEEEEEEENVVMMALGGGKGLGGYLSSLDSGAAITDDDNNDSDDDGEDVPTKTFMSDYLTTLTTVEVDDVITKVVEEAEPLEEDLVPPPPPPVVEVDDEITRLVKEAEDTVAVQNSLDEENTEEAEVLENDLEASLDVDISIDAESDIEDEMDATTAITDDDNDDSDGDGMPKTTVAVQNSLDEENTEEAEVLENDLEASLDVDISIDAESDIEDEMDATTAITDDDNDDSDGDGMPKTFVSDYLTTLNTDTTSSSSSTSMENDTEEVQEATINDDDDEDSLSIEEQQITRMEQKKEQQEEAALNLIRRYLQDRDRLDYYYYDQDKLNDDYFYQEEETKAPSPRIISSLVNFFRGSGEGDGEGGEVDRRPLLPSQIVKEYFADDAEYIDGLYYGKAVGGSAIVRHLGLYGSRRSLFEKKTTTKTNAPSSKNDEEEEDVDEVEEIEEGVKMLCDDIALQEDETNNGIRVVTTYHYEYSDGSTVPDSRGITSYALSPSTSDSGGGELRIAQVVDFMEPPSPKPGDSGLKLLSLASDVQAAIESRSSSATTTAPTPPTDNAVVVDEEDTIVVMKDEIDTEESLIANTDNDEVSSTTTTITEKYFQAFNARDIPRAASCVTDDCEYIDTQYPGSTFGKAPLAAQFTRVAKALPPTFRFVVDNVVEDVRRGTVGVQWHVEDNDETSDSGGKELPFTRGLTFNRLEEEQEVATTTERLIEYAIDVPEPAVIKSGTFLRIRNLIQNDPIRLLPLTVWGLYTYIVFFSDGIIPGANALQLEGRTWEEVRDLSLNFFLISPTLNLPFAPTTVHPILEGVFNLLLSWAALFSGFLSDEREDKPNVLEMGYVVLGMQFLTSAFYLPYLVSRTPESPRLILNDGTQSEVYYDDGDDEKVIEIDFDATVTRQDIKGQQIQSKIAENKQFHSILGAVGSYSILWGIFARAEDGFGTTLPDRFDSFWELIAIDRVGFSFLVDLAIFGAFQGWLVDDDLRRRGLAPELAGTIRTVGKYVPFFGLVAYLFMRPALPSSVPYSDDKSDVVAVVEDDTTTTM